MSQMLFFIHTNLLYGFTHINSVKPHSLPMNRYHYSHFIDKKLRHREVK